MGTWNPDFDNIDKDDANGGDEKCLTFFGEDGGFNMHRAGNNVLFGDGHVQVYKRFEPASMTHNPHLMQTWEELTGD